MGTRAWARSLPEITGGFPSGAGPGTQGGLGLDTDLLAGPVHRLPAGITRMRFANITHAPGCQGSPRLKGSCRPPSPDGLVLDFQSETGGHRLDSSDALAKLGAHPPTPGPRWASPRRRGGTGYKNMNGARKRPGACQGQRNVSNAVASGLTRYQGARQISPVKLVLVAAGTIDKLGLD